MSEYINFLNEDEVFKKNFRRKKLAKFIVACMVIAATVIAVYSLNVLLTMSSQGESQSTQADSASFISGLFNSLRKINILDQLGGIAAIGKSSLSGEENNRVNILLLGIGGGNHEGSQLSDTIILASIDTLNKRAGMISIPRDLLAPIPEYGWYKINSANAFGEQKGEGQGIDLSKEVVQDITGQTINYYVRIDFSGFEKLIDDLGGVCMEVENNLIDYQYPVLGKEYDYPISSRFEYLHIDKGWQCMDGALALKYARSRHGIGGEGSDFARARRQQILLAAIKDKVFSFKTFLDPQKIIKILDDLRDNIKTDLKVSEIARLAKLGGDIDIKKITKKVLDNSPASPLQDDMIETEGGLKAYVLKTKTGDFSEVKSIAANLFIEEEVKEAAKEAAAPVLEENAAIEIQNGTKISGLAYAASLDLKKADLNIIKVGNALRQNYEKTVIYDLTPDKYQNTVNLLKDKLGADVSYSLPVWMDRASTTADILVVLGRES